MILKKKKAVIAAILSAALTVSAMMPAVSAAGTRTKEEKYGDDSYAKRFLSLYDDVITNGEQNGYLSSRNKASGGFGVPYHAVEELIIEAPDYGHETTSEAMSYIVWMAAMRDHISSTGSITNPDGTTTSVDSTNDLTKAWKTMEMMIPEVQKSAENVSFMDKAQPSATYAEEWDTPEAYTTPQRTGNNGINPIHAKFTQVYSSDDGLYLMHWLADVDDWYGYGGNSGNFTFINTFQRGAQESCWETVPHPCVEELKYGNPTSGVKGIFNCDGATEQYAYTNAPDAEDRAIQAVYAANRWGVGNSDISAKAGKMGDQLRNNMFDKYYKKIGACDPNNQANNNTVGAYEGAHFLMSWYTSWGGSLRADQGSWTWQIGASHCHEFYQNPLAAYALLEDDDLRNGMKTADDAIKDYTKSLQRQLEFYLWLQSVDGPIAGGATSSWHGRYLKYEYLADVDKEYIDKYGTNIPTTFYDMGYQEHPVYADPGSNGWIGNQVWAIQRLAELYYVIKEGNTNQYVEAVKLQQVNASGQVTEMSIEEALEAILDRWVGWFVSNVKLYDDGTYAIPAVLGWHGQPATWTGTYDPDANSVQNNGDGTVGLTCEVTAWGTSDLGCVSSLANTLIYYAKCNNVSADAAYKDSDVLAEKALYYAHSLLDREWAMGRDDIGLSVAETNGSMSRLFEQDVFIPTYYTGTMPNGDTLANGATFLSIRSQYLGENKDGTNSSAWTPGTSGKYGTSTEIGGKYYSDNRGYVAKFKAAYDEYASKTYASEEEKAAAKTAAMESVKLNYHRFWHAGDILIALGTMYDLYPEVEPDKYDDVDPSGKLDVEKDTIEVEVGKTDTIKPNKDGCTFTSADPGIATVDENGVVTGVAEGTTTVTVTLDNETVEVTVKVTAEATIPTGSFDPSDLLYGDVNLDESVDSTDIVVLNKYLISTSKYSLQNAQAYEQANTVYDKDADGVGIIDSKDAMAIINFVLKVVDLDDLGPAR